MIREASHSGVEAHSQRMNRIDGERVVGIAFRHHGVHAVSLKLDQHLTERGQVGPRLRKHKCFDNLIRGHYCGSR